MFALIADQLGDGPWLLGDQFSAADLFLFLLMRWGRAMPSPPRLLAPLAAHAQRVLARPAVQRLLALLREPGARAELRARGFEVGPAPTAATETAAQANDA